MTENEKLDPDKMSKIQGYNFSKTLKIPKIFIDRAVLEGVLEEEMIEMRKLKNLNQALEQYHPFLINERLLDV